MSRSLLAGTRRRLALVLGLFFVALVVPSLVLIAKAYDQLKWEAFRQQQMAADKLVGRIDQRLKALIEVEDARPVIDYRFLRVEGDPSAGFVQRSPLAALPAHSDIPGVVGWFQVEERPDGPDLFSTPLLPTDTDPRSLGLGDAEIDERRRLARGIERVLEELGDSAGSAEVAEEEPIPSDASVDTAEKVVGTLGMKKDADQQAPVEPRSQAAQSVDDTIAASATGATGWGQDKSRLAGAPAPVEHDAMPLVAKEVEVASGDAPARRSEEAFASAAAAPLVAEPAPAPASVPMASSPPAAPLAAALRAESQGSVQTGERFLDQLKQRVRQVFHQSESEPSLDSGVDADGFDRAEALARVAKERELAERIERGRRRAERRSAVRVEQFSVQGRDERTDVVSTKALGRLEDLKLEADYARRTDRLAKAMPAEPKRRKAAVKRSARTERSAVADLDLGRSQFAAPVQVLGALTPAAAGVELLDEPDEDLADERQVRIRFFDSEVGPLELIAAGSEHFALVRRVLHDHRRYVQGLLIERGSFLEGAFEKPFRDAAVSALSELIVAFNDDLIAAYRGGGRQRYPTTASELTGSLLRQARLSAPLSDLKVVLSLTRLPPGPGLGVVAWTGAALLLVLVVGTWALYRLGVRQLALVRQQQDFVSAVSHELRTPLTSIRMYSEMLQEGWVPADKMRGYYRSIGEESERLTRLIENLLTLSRLERQRLKLQSQPCAAATLLGKAAARLGEQARRAGFELRVDCSVEGSIEVDPDALLQILMNLVDNALKFAAVADVKVIELGCARDQRHLVLRVRDFGPGVPRDQMKRVWELFYRVEDERTRSTKGTGIGLALVRQLSEAMGGSVSLENRSPGLEVRLRFSCAEH